MAKNLFGIALLGGAGGNSMFPFGQPQQSQEQQPQQQQQTPFWADPQFIQASMRMQQAMMGSQQQPNTNNTDNNTTQSNLLQQMMMGFPSGGFG